MPRPTRSSSPLRATFVVLVLAAFIGLVAAGHDARPQAPSPGENDLSVQAHEQPPTKPHVPTPPQPPLGTGGPAGGPIARNGYISYQVNVDADGHNIVGDAGKNRAALRCAGASLRPPGNKDRLS